MSAIVTKKVMTCAVCNGYVEIKKGWHSCPCGKLCVDVGDYIYRVLGNAVENEQGQRVKEVERA